VFVVPPAFVALINIVNDAPSVQAAVVVSQFVLAPLPDTAPAVHELPLFKE
jgi:hypothetical protein